MEACKKIKKKKKISFEAAEPHSDLLLTPPAPSINFVPKWFKEQKIFSNKATNFFEAHKKGNLHFTYKLCVPITDTITLGYMVTLPADILVKNVSENGGYTPYISWYVDFALADTLEAEAIGNYPVPFNHNNLGFRWIHDWIIKTPKGYSALIMHPVHRQDLPFFTLTGLVDTDKHPNKLLFPFFIREGFEGVIPEGTPIAQILPFKRDDWEMKKTSYSDKTQIIKNNFMKLNFMRTYKNKIWARKKYT